MFRNNGKYKSLKIGKTENEIEHLEVILPDHGANQIQCFLNILISENGPTTIEDQYLFSELLNFFAKDSSAFCDSKEGWTLKDEKVIEDLVLPPFQFPSASVTTCDDLPKESLDEILEWEEALGAVNSKIQEEPNLDVLCNDDIPLSKSHKSKQKKRKNRKQYVKEEDGKYCGMQVC